MINKISPSIAEALTGVADGSTVLIGGLGTAGIPNEPIEGPIEHGARGAAQGRARAQDHLLVPTPDRLLGV